MTDERNDSLDATKPDFDDRALESHSDAAIAEHIEDATAQRGAEVLEELPPERAADIAEYLDPETAARAVTELHPERAAEIIEQMEAPEAASLLEEMDPDDRVDVLEHVNDLHHDRILSHLDELARTEVERLESYPPDTAGGIMTTEVTALFEYISVGDAIETLRVLHAELEQMFYVYVINRGGQLVGVLSMRDLILSKPATRLRDIMIKGVASVPADMDQEDVAKLMREKRYLAMPVVDGDRKLIGLITADDVADVFAEEATEDFQKMFGAGAEERLSSPWHFSFRKRIWWLVINLATAFLAAMVVGAFEGTIEKLAILAAYMPIIAGMGGNASAQAMAVAIRGLAMGKVDRSVLRHVIVRESIVGLLTGIVCGLITAFVAYNFPGSDLGPDRAAKLGLVMLLALAINHTLACASGAAIPFIMKRLGFDPAQSSTIFATTVTDVAGFLALLGLASVILL
jgi:magnesium transporter